MLQTGTAFPRASMSAHRDLEQTVQSGSKTGAGVTVEVNIQGLLQIVLL